MNRSDGVISPMQWEEEHVQILYNTRVVMIDQDNSLCEV